MSFSENVKDEILEYIDSSRHCRIAELTAMLWMLDAIGDIDKIEQNDNRYVKQKANRLIKMLGLDMSSDETYKAMKASKTEEGYSIGNILVERGCCKKAFVRGAFLAAGSVTNPQKGYHFEIVCDTDEQAQMLVNLIRSFDMEPKLVERKKYKVVYLKDGSNIVDILNVMGAHLSLMDMENVRIVKEMRNTVNRRVNCETANINRTVNAAVKQIEDIQYIEQTVGLKYLPDNLRELAVLRLEEDELPLKDLGAKLNPPLGKSGVNHRLRKISEIAEELRRN